MAKSKKAVASAKSAPAKKSAKSKASKAASKASAPAKKGGKSSAKAVQAAAKKAVGKDAYGSRVGTGAAKINEFIAKKQKAPMTTAEIAEHLGEKQIRINRHVDWLKNPQEGKHGGGLVIKYAGAKWGRPGLKEPKAAKSK
jgi:hypothetical protein